MHVIKLELEPLNDHTLCIRCSRRHVLRRLLDYLKKNPDVGATSEKILYGNAIWFRTETADECQRVKNILHKGVAPLFLAEAAVLPGPVSRHIFLIWGVLNALAYPIMAVRHLLDGTESASGAYLSGLVVVAWALTMKGMVERRAAKAVRDVHRIFMDELKKDEHAGK